MEHVFFIELSLIILVTTLVAAMLRPLKQPLIIGYMVAGIIVSPGILNIARSVDSIAVFSQIGVALLLFIVGLSLTPQAIREVGLVAVITGTGQILFTSFFGYFIAKYFGFDHITAIYIAVALTFSSTIIIMKLLTDKEDTDSLYGKISIGFLLVQDLFVVIILMFVSSLGAGSDNGLNSILMSFLQGFLVFIAASVIGLGFFPRISNFIAGSAEFLFLFAISWCLLLASAFVYFGLSIEVGALVAGVTLSTSPFNYQISSRIRPLKDFFIALFFVYLGTQVIFADITPYIVPTIVFSFFILIGNPIIVMVLMGLLGYTKRVGFLAGLTVAQISEFSLILIAAGIKLGHIPSYILPIVTVIGLITITGSTYMILFSENIYRVLSPYLVVFERNGKNIDKKEDIIQDYDVILFGLGRVGYGTFNTLGGLGYKVLAVDQNPAAITKLHDKDRFIYGDADDIEFISSLKLDKTKMVVSSIPHFETNMTLVNEIQKVNKNCILIVVAHRINDAKKLYGAGADYIIMPHFLGSEHAVDIISFNRFDKEKYAREKDFHLVELEKKQRLGFEYDGIK